MSTNRKPSQRYNPGSLDETDTETLKMGIAEELWDISTSFLQTDEILGDAHEKIDTLEIDRDKANARIEEIYRLSVEGDVALAEKITNISAEMETENAATNAAIKEEAKARADGDSALAEKITTLKAEMETEDASTNSAIKEEARARADADSALAETITKLTADVVAGDNSLSSQITDTNKVISELEKTTAENKLELSSSITSVKDNAKSDLDKAQAALDKAIADGDAAEAERLRAEIGRLQGIIDNNKSDIEAKLSITNNTIVELDKAVASNKLELESSIKNAKDELTAKDEAVLSQAEKDLEVARKALTEAIASGDADAAKKLQEEVNRLLGIIGDYKTEVEAKLSVINTTIANGDKALSEQITSAEASFNGQIAGVNQTISAHADKLGNVEAKWGMELDVNGKISGIQMNNNGARSNFDVRADYFSFTNHYNKGISSDGFNTTFSGIIYADGGVFNGTVNAIGGDFRNVTIREDCKVLGTLYADRIVGLPTSKKFYIGDTNLTPRPDNGWLTIYSATTPSAQGRFNMDAMLGGLPMIKSAGGTASVTIRICVNGVQRVVTDIHTASTSWTHVGGLSGMPFACGEHGGTVTVEYHIPQYSPGGFMFRWENGTIYSSIDNGAFW